MLKGITIALGVGLICLWLTGIAMKSGATPWMTWLDLFSGLLALGLAAMMRPHVSRGVHGSGVLFLSFIIFALGLANFSSAAAPWQAWWNFFFAGALFLVGVGVLIRFDLKTLSLPWREPRFANFSPSGYGHGFLFPADRDHYHPLLGERDSGVAAGRAPRHYTRSDQRIEEDIYERLSHGWALDASDVRVSVERGEATLSGAVENRRSRRCAEEIADNVLGVKDIHNELVIRSHQVSEAGEFPKPKRVA